MEQYINPENLGLGGLLFWFMRQYLKKMDKQNEVIESLVKAISPIVGNCPLVNGGGKNGGI